MHASVGMTSMVVAPQAGHINTDSIISDCGISGRLSFALRRAERDFISEGILDVDTKATTKPTTGMKSGGANGRA